MSKAIMKATKRSANNKIPLPNPPSNRPIAPPKKSPTLPDISMES